MSEGALANIRVLDLSRILAGPWCGQILADLGADVIKVERPGRGDDTRAWGPPYVRDANGAETTEAAYYVCANRGKRSVTVDITAPAGQAVVRELAAQSDDQALKDYFTPVAKNLEAKLDVIFEEMEAVKGKPVDLGGYYHPDPEKVKVGMRPSATFNSILGSLTPVV